MEVSTVTLLSLCIHRCVNMYVYMYMHMCAIWGIYVCIHVHERKCFILEELQHSALFLFCTPKTICLVELILGHISHYGFKPPLPGFIYFMYISSTTSVLYLSHLYMNCMPLGNKHCFIVIVIIVILIVIVKFADDILKYVFSNEEY